MSFHEIDFPLSLAFGATGGPVRVTDIVTLANGTEQRNTHSANSRRKYDAGIGVRSLEDVQILISFFEARKGQLYGFRFRDPFDHKSSQDGENIGIGNGVEMQFQLVKHYADNEGSWVRKITKPVAGTVQIYVDEQIVSDVSVDNSTGIISFQSPPANSQIIKAVFEFDVPVRFDSDHISTSLEGFGGGKTVSVPLIEVLPYA